MNLAALDDRLTHLLTTYDLLDATVVDHARAYARRRRGTLGGSLTALRLLPDETIARLLHEATGVRAIDPSRLDLHADFVPAISELLPADLVRALTVFPVQRELNTVHVCMLDPSDGATVRALESVSGCRVAPLVSHEEWLADALERHYQRSRGEAAIPDPAATRAAAVEAYRALLKRPFDTFTAPALAVVHRQDSTPNDGVPLESVIRHPAVVRLVQQILCRAIEAGTSDIHVEPSAESLRIRVRIDGAMHVAHALPATAGPPIAARLKVMAGVTLTPAVQPIDARISQELVWDRPIVLRFSLVPSIAGEHIVLRVLDHERERLSLGELGMPAHDRAVVEDACDAGCGLVLVSGPTGCGKTSTLYALLDRLNNEGASILTAEDPVESRLPGVTQVSCDASMTFAAALRSFLRQDPDVMMVGEIRDGDTADVALKAATTGHLVLSTLHTDDAAGAILRLLNLDTEPFVVASAIRAVAAQRLLRTLCSECKTPASLDGCSRALVDACSLEVRAAINQGTLYQPRGCARCGGTGYSGRTGVFEVLRVTDRLAELIARRATAAEIRAAARMEGMRTLREAALVKAAMGETSLLEAVEHTRCDRETPPLRKVANV